MKRFSFLGIFLFLFLIIASGDIAAKMRKARFPSSMGSFGNAGNWLPRGSLFDFDHGAGFDLPGFGDPLDDGDPFFGDGGGDGNDGIPGGMLQGGQGHEWGFGEDGGIDTTKGIGGCGIDDCYKATWAGPCEYKCECHVTWDPGHGNPTTGHHRGEKLWGHCYYGDDIRGTALGDCRYEGQECYTDDW